MKTATPEATVTAADLLRHFNRTLRVSFEAPADLLTAANVAIAGCRQAKMYAEDVREQHLIALVNAKLKLNKERLQALLDAAAKVRALPNYHDKVEILSCLDYRDRARYQRWQRGSGIRIDLSAHFDPVTESIAGLKELLRTAR